MQCAVWSPQLSEGQSCAAEVEHKGSTCSCTFINNEQCFCNVVNIVVAMKRASGWRSGTAAKQLQCLSWLRRPGAAIRCALRRQYGSGSADGAPAAASLQAALTELALQHWPADGSQNWTSADLADFEPVSRRFNAVPSRETSAPAQPQQPAALPAASSGEFDVLDSAFDATYAQQPSLDSAGGSGSPDVAARRRTRRSSPASASAAAAAAAALRGEGIAPATFTAASGTAAAEAPAAGATAGAARGGVAIDAPELTYRLRTARHVEELRWVVATYGAAFNHVHVATAFNRGAKLAAAGALAPPPKLTSAAPPAPALRALRPAPLPASGAAARGGSRGPGSAAPRGAALPAAADAAASGPDAILSLIAELRLLAAATLPHMGAREASQVHLRWGRCALFQLLPACSCFACRSIRAPFSTEIFAFRVPHGSTPSSNPHPGACPHIAA